VWPHRQLTFPSNSRLEKLYHRADKVIQQIVNLLAPLDSALTNVGTVPV
jgi:hypothetical protein